MTRYRNGLKKAQSIVEYAMVLACIVAALLAMQHYIKRAAEGRLREVADSIGGQYDVHRINSRVTLTQSGTTITDSQQVREPAAEAEEGRVDGVKTTTTTQGEVVRRTGYEQLQTFSGLYD